MQAREDLIGIIVGKMPEEHRRFLISIKRGEPDWALLDLPSVEDLPAVRWRLENLAKLDKTKRDAMIARLSEVLDIAN